MLAQSYDWLVFLSDEGLIDFLEDVILDPLPEFRSIIQAFHASYGPEKRKNQFTKVQMNWSAHKQLLRYFANNASKIENWFNVISPEKGSLGQLQDQIQMLRCKEWLEILE